MLFAARPFQYLGDNDVLILQMINFVESLPQEWQEKWELILQSSPIDRRQEQHLSGAAELNGSSKLERRFQDMVQERELMPLLRVIQGLMRFLPSQRISADAALELLLE